MKVLVLCAAIAVLALGGAAPTWAHGDEPHPKCKKGYVLNDEHKCVKDKKG